MLDIQGKSIELILNERIPDQKFEKSEVAIPLFRLTGDTIEANIPALGNKNVINKIKFPKMVGCKDTAYGYLFFNGVENNPLKANIPMLIGNYNQSQPMKLWIDMNCNFDFNDDGDPDEIVRNFKYIDLILNNSKVTDGLYITRLSKFNFSNNSSYYFMLEKYFKNLYPNRRFLGPNYCFREQQLRTVAKRVHIGNDSFSIGLYDGNGNGLYTDEEEDEIVIGEYHDKFISTLEEDGAIVFSNKKTYTFSKRGLIYEVSNIDQAGKFLSIKLLSNKVAIGPEIGKKLKFKFKTHKDKYVKLKKYRCKKVVLYFFDWNNPELKNDTIALNEIHHKYGKKIKVIILNYGSQPGLIKNYVQFGKISYICGISSKEINLKCSVEKYPSTIFLKRFNKVKLTNTSPQEILEQLNNKKL